MPITVFTKSVTGYNKREVDEYIANVNRAFLKSKHDYEKKIEILEAEISKLKRELEKAQANAPDPVAAVPAASDVTPTVPVDDDIAEKLRRYDEISMRVGEIYMNANAEASVIIREADEKVKTTLTDTMSTIRAEVTFLMAKLGELLESAEETLSVDDEDGADA